MIRWVLTLVLVLCIVGETWQESSGSIDDDVAVDSLEKRGWKKNKAKKNNKNKTEENENENENEIGKENENSETQKAKKGGKKKGKKCKKCNDDKKDENENTNNEPEDDEIEDSKTEDNEIEDNTTEDNTSDNGDNTAKGDIELCVDAHNTLRGLHQNTNPLEWDADIAEKAQAYAEKLVKLNEGEKEVILEHDVDEMGENLAWTSIRVKSTCVEAALMWYSEINDYDFETGQTKKAGAAVGHFTQVVWASTTKFGVGIATAPSRNSDNIETYIVAKYAPGGNNGKYLDNVQPRHENAVTPENLPTNREPLNKCEDRNESCGLLMASGFDCATDVMVYNCYLSCGNC